MNELIDVLARAEARSKGRIVPLRSTSGIAPDERPVFGIASIKLVSEEVIQAIAFGDLDGEPSVITRWHPLSRDTATLEIFADALNQYIEDCLILNRLPRIWVPHKAALTLIDLLGHRYRRNEAASQALQRMGQYCYILADEARITGQQAVIVATELLIAHAATGQTPLEDRHLGALLAWHEADGSYDPVEESLQRSMIPAAAMLKREADDRVEALRAIAKTGGDGAEEARIEIESLQEDGALHEWDLLVRARRAFLSLGLPPIPGLARLVEETRSRLAWAFERFPNRPARPKALAQLLEENEYSNDVVEDMEVRGDEMMRERARRAGRAIAGTVIQIDQPRSSRHPCTLTLFSNQSVLRVRPGTQLRNLLGTVEGRVAEVCRNPGGDGQQIVLRLTKGVRRSVRPGLGTHLDWTDTIPFDGRMGKGLAYNTALQAGAFTLVDGEPTPRRPRNVGIADLAGVADGFRR